ncbi:hypothetical protein COCMIDRAFT_108068, partial [Bipolaris oryzae ATCC 44560]
LRLPFTGVGFIYRLCPSFLGIDSIMRISGPRDFLHAVQSRLCCYKNGICIEMDFSREWDYQRMKITASTQKIP